MFGSCIAVSVSLEQMFGVHKCRENGILRRPWEVLLLECGQQQTVSLSVRYLWKESERSKNSCVQMAGVVRLVEYPPIAQAEGGRPSLFPMLRPNHSRELNNWRSDPHLQKRKEWLTMSGIALTRVEYKGSTDRGRGGGMKFWGWRSEGQPYQGKPRFLQKWCMIWRSLVKSQCNLFTQPYTKVHCTWEVAISGNRLVQIIMSALVL